MHLCSVVPQHALDMTTESKRTHPKRSCQNYQEEFQTTIFPCSVNHRGLLALGVQQPTQSFAGYARVTR